MARIEAFANSNGDPFDPDGSNPILNYPYDDAQPNL
jgi:hypothetical protein